MSHSESATARRGRWMAAGLFAAVCLAVGGCGRSNWGTVEGVVTLGGDPVGPGTLIFEPVDLEQTRSGMAHFGEDGRYELKSAGNEPGVPPGEYRVRIDSRGEEAFGEEQVGPTAPSKIPPRYRDYSAGLTATVESGSNTIDFELQP